MSDLRALLDQIKARADAATEGPWEIEFRAPVMQGVTWNLRQAGAPGIRISATEYQHGTANAEFIAAARTDVPRLAAAFLAVLRLHKCLIFEDDGFGEPTACSHCDNQTWPCNTLDAITTALEAHHA